MTLPGTVTGFTREKVELSDGNSIYSIEKSELPPNEQQTLNSAKVGMRVTLHVPLDAIKEVKPAKATAKN